MRESYTVEEKNHDGKKIKFFCGRKLTFPTFAVIMNEAFGKGANETFALSVTAAKSKKFTRRYEPWTTEVEATKNPDYLSAARAFLIRNFKRRFFMLFCARSL